MTNQVLVLEGDRIDSRNHEAKDHGRYTVQMAGVEAGRDVSKESDKKDKVERRRSMTKEQGRATWADLGLHKMNQISNAKFKGRKAKAGAGPSKAGLDKYKQLGIEEFISKTRDSNRGKSHGKTKTKLDQLATEPCDLNLL